MVGHAMSLECIDLSLPICTAVGTADRRRTEKWSLGRVALVD